MNVETILARKVWKRMIMALVIVTAICVAAWNLLVKIEKRDSGNSQVLVGARDAVSDEIISDITVKVIQGKDNPTGESICQVLGEENKEMFIELPYGEYTIQWSADGYYTAYQNLEVREKDSFVRGRMIPIYQENAAYVLVEWENGTDIDLCVYSEQTGRCIGKETTLDDAGSFSYGDNDKMKGYELVYLSEYDINAYRIYVKNNEISTKDQKSSEEIVRATVSIYTSSGLLYQKETCSMQETVLWHCVDMSCGQIKEWNENVFDLTEYAWAARDKGNPESWIGNTSIKVEEKYKYYGERYGLEVNKFDINGNETSYFKYGTNGEIIYGCEYEYDENSNLLASYEYEYEEGVLLCSKFEYAYDKDGNRIISLKYDGDGKLSSREEYTYDTNGNQISNVYYDGDGRLIIREEYTYDRNGNELSHLLYSSEGLYSRWETDYDENGNELSICTYDGDGVLESKWETEYDAAGNEIVLYSYGINGVLESKWETEYDAMGNEISCRKYGESGLLEYEVESQYDSAGNRIGRYTYDDEGELTEKREYDILGNQTACYKYENGILTDKYIDVYDANGKQTEYYEYHYQNGKFETGKMLKYKYEEKGEYITYYGYDSNMNMDEIKTYDHIYEYDAIGGMKIYYYYVDGILTTKTITLYY